MGKEKLHFFKHCLLRTPVFPTSMLDEVSSIQNIIDNPYFRDAIYISSKVLYEDIYIKGILNEKTELALLRYFVRACTRCTPYGNFAGCCSVPFRDISEIRINTSESFSTYTRVDMDVLCRISTFIEQDIEEREHLLYHINTSLYCIGERIRYIEYNKETGKRHYSFSEVLNNEYIDKVINFVHYRQCKFSDIVQCLISVDISEDDAKDFVMELINIQILVSNLEPAIAGEDLLTQIIQKLQYSKYLQHLTLINQAVKECDKVDFGKKLSAYEKTDELIKKIVPIKEQALFHSDCKIDAVRASIGPDIQNAIIKGISILNRISFPKENALLQSFKTAFYQKYEEQEIPLPIALDPQNGIPIGKWNSQYGDTNPLVEDVVLPFQANTLSSSTNPFDKLLIEKYEEYLREGGAHIELTNKDLKKLPQQKLPSSYWQFYTLIQVLSLDESNQTALINMDSAIIGNAASLLSRFEYLDSSITDLVNDITKHQQNYSTNIYAEILHLPEDRIGNIQMHPINREYAIAYFSNPFEHSETQKIFHLDDIMVSVPLGQRIKLRSKKLDKEIIPVLTTAHNYSTGLPIYLFLCSLQNQQTKFLHFDWCEYFSNKKFLPQVRYENIILSPAKWVVELNAFPKVHEKYVGENEFEQIEKWRQQEKISSKVLVVEGDNKLYIDFHKIELVRVFVQYLIKRKSLLVEEFLYDNQKSNLVKQKTDWFTNELLVCGYYGND